AGELRRGLAAAAIAFEAKPFKAHLTLARLKAPQAVARFGGPPPPMAFTADEVVLFQSLPEQGGHRYLPLGQIPLAP
ncbi:MAG TPA: 2'-5' RNA ligase family protein, partial [Holophaga sp.]|nr:2'-5' RNA ligase family protein [Holophaga sp.]